MTQHNSGQEWVGGNQGQVVEEDDKSQTIHPRTASAPETAYYTGLGNRQRGALATNEQAPTFEARMVAEQDPSSKPRRAITRQEIVNCARHWMSYIRIFALDTVSGGSRPFYYPLFFLVVCMIAYFMAGMPAFKPLCIIPGVSDTPFCQPLYAAVDFPALVAAETKTVDQLEHAYLGGSSLSLQLKQSEVAMRDLVVLVQVSDLRAKGLLADTLMAFVHNARKTGKGLQRLSSKFGGSIDNIITINEYALRLIESARAPSSISALIAGSIGRNPSKAVVTEAFENALHTISINLERLIVEAEASEKNLMDLDVNLSSLHEIVTQETSIISGKMDNVLRALLTGLGGNRRTLRNLELLQDIGIYREDASDLVASALHALRAMQQDIEDIRDRAATPELIGRSVPVEVHINSLSMGLQRMKDGRLQAKTLEEKEVERILSKL